MIQDSPTPHEPLTPEQLLADNRRLVELLERIAMRARYASALPEQTPFRVDFCRSVLEWIEPVMSGRDVQPEVERLTGWLRFMIDQLPAYDGAPDGADAYVDMAEKALDGEAAPQ